VGIAALTGFALAVGPKLPDTVRDMASLASWCRMQPTQTACGNAGAGSMPHFMAVMMARALGLDLNHVPYRGGSAAMRAVAAGEVAAAIGTESSALALAQAGKLRVIATSGQIRSTFLPEAASFAEQGLGSLTMQEWFGVFLPPHSSAERIGAVNRSLSDALKAPGVADTWKSLALTTESWSPEMLASQVARELAFWGRVIKASGFTPEA
jgi:tripartite-type tricarboxylate transporter receptor subunit TctC